MNYIRTFLYLFMLLNCVVLIHWIYRSPLLTVNGFKVFYVNGIRGGMSNESVHEDKKSIQSENQVNGNSSVSQLQSTKSPEKESPELQSKDQPLGLGELSLEQFLKIKPVPPKEVKADVEGYYKRYSATCHLRDEELQRSNTSRICPCLPNTIVGPVFEKKPVLSSTASKTVIEKVSVEVNEGGWWKPSLCQPRWSVAIVIPFRNREPHLSIFLKYLHPFLQHQQIEYRIFVIEQGYPELFNRAGLLNIGFMEAMKRTQHKFDCVVFHDVDIIPEDARSMYTCEFAPLHLGAYLSKFNHKLPYVQYFGGATAIKVEQFKTVNGFSNLFFGWGGEDDDHFHRIGVLLSNVMAFRYPQYIGKSFMIAHKRDKGNEVGNLRWGGTKYFSASQYKSEGLSSTNYTVVASKDFPLYTWVKVKLNKPESHAPCIKAGVDCWNSKVLQKGNLDCCVEKQGPKCCHKPLPSYGGKGPKIQIYIVH